VRTFNLDEFDGLGPDAATSYRAFMERHLFAHVNVAPQHIGFLDGTAPDIEAECRRYDAAIHDAGGLDLLVLGLGSNGHIGFNEPGPALDALTHRVVLRDETRAANATWFGGRVDRVPAEALSMGLAPILSARAVLLVATGAAKAEAAAGMIEGRVTPHLPASFLQLHQRATVLLDSAAAAGLRSRSPGPSSAGGRQAAR
jgi:glucosamine-6-phosphate deaminase